MSLNRQTARQSFHRLHKLTPPEAALEEKKNLRISFLWCNSLPVFYITLKHTDDMSKDDLWSAIKLFRVAANLKPTCHLLNQRSVPARKWLRAAGGSGGGCYSNGFVSLIILSPVGPAMRRRGDASTRQRCAGE